MARRLKESGILALMHDGLIHMFLFLGPIVVER